MEEASPEILAVASNLTSRSAAALLVQRCALAVHVGSPLYNRGAIRECAEVYQQALTRSIEAPDTPVAVAVYFSEALANSQALVSASRRAWVLRVALDTAIKMVSTPPGGRPRTPSSSEGGHRSDSSGMAVGWTRESRAAKSARHLRVTPSALAGTLVGVSVGGHPPDAAQPEQQQQQPQAVHAAARVCHLLVLPDDLSDIVLSKLTARSLSSLSGTSSSWRGRAQMRAEVLMRAHQPALFRGSPTTSTDDRPHPHWVRALRSMEQVQAAVGPRPAARKWWDEWTQLRTVETKLTLHIEVDPQSFQPGGDRSIKALLRQYAAGLSWMIDAGWAPLHASAAMLLLACGSTAIGDTIRNGSPEFAASTHALFDALRQRAWAISTAAPPTYANLEGVFGLASADPAWLTLLEPGMESGHSFLTSAPLQANIYPTVELKATDPPAGSGEEDAEAAAAGGCPIVCFISEVKGCGCDALRTLVQTSPIGFALMPFARITLVAVHAEGTWRHGEHTMMRKSFCVTVSSAY